MRGLRRSHFVLLINDDFEFQIQNGRITEWEKEVINVSSEADLAQNLFFNVVDPRLTTRERVKDLELMIGSHSL